MTSEKLVELKELATPLVKWLNGNFNPHCEIRITDNGVQILQVEMSNTFNGEFLDNPVVRASDALPHQDPWPGTPPAKLSDAWYSKPDVS